MLRVTPSTSAAGAKKYFTESLTRDDTGYYHEGQELAGKWGGKGAAMLGLQGPVSQPDFFALCDNRNPQTGEQITLRNKANRRIAFDFTYSDPKSVSALYGVTGDERILEAHNLSVDETMREAEADMKARVRKMGADHDRATGNMVWAAFTHKTARPVGGKPDSHLHTHVYAFNMTHDGVENTWKAGQFGDLKRDAGYYEAAYDARMAKRLNALGYPVEKRGYSYEIAGVPQSVIDKFSRRRDEIERKAAEKGVTDAKGKHDIGYRGRERKNTGLTKAELRKEWSARLTDDERSSLRKHGPAKPGHTSEEAKDYAIAHTFERASTVSEKRLKTEALKYGVGSVLPESVADITQHPEVIAKSKDGQLMTTTKGVLRDEVAMLRFAKDGQRKHPQFVSIFSADVNKPGGFVSIPAREEELGQYAKAPDSSRSGTSVAGNSKGIEFDGFEKTAGHFNPLAGLSEEQTKAALHVLNSRDTVTGVIGRAGTGKTTMMRATRDAIESVPGQHVFAFAPSSQAKGVLAKEGFKDAETLAMLLKNPKLQEKTKGQTLWIDEAGLVSSKDMRAAFDIAKRNGNRLILSGDYAQHSSVEAGDAFRLLEKEGGVRFARLTENRRQKEPAYRKAVEAIAKGTGRAAQKGFDALDGMGSIIEAGPERHSLLVGDYLKAVDDGKSALIIAPTHSEGDKLTSELRAALKERGQLGKDREFVSWKSTGWTDAQKGDARNYEPGMVLEFNQNAKGFKRGERAVVVVGSAPAGKTAGSGHESGIHLLKTDGSRTPLPVTQAQRFDVFRTRDIAIGVGDRIRITKNGEAKVEGQPKGTRVNNGEIFTVEGFTKEGDIRLENGKLLPKDWGHMQPGYVDTSYASQGKTVDRVFISVGQESLPAANAKQWYVSASRGREQAKLYVDSKEDVRNAISRTGDRMSAVELVRPKDSWRHRFYQSLERNRVGRFLKDRATAIADRWRGQEQRHA